MIAVSRQQPRTNAKTHARQIQLSTSLPLQDTDVPPSQLLSAHTHTPNSLQTYTHSLPPSQTMRQLHSTTTTTTTVLFFGTVVFGGHCFKPREDGAEKEDEVVTSNMQSWPSLYSTVSIKKGARHSMSGRRTLLIWSSFKRRHLPDRDPSRATPKWMYCKRGKKIQPLVLNSWGGKVASEFGVCWSVCFLFFLFLF